MTKSHIHILGICGTFMAGIAVLAKQAGYEVSGSDANAYPPMSDELRAQGIAIHMGYDPAALTPRPDMVIIGNALSRGNPSVEYVLNEGLPYMSGPEWLSRHVLQSRTVLAVAGTHGKTTTTSLLTWILMRAGLNPGFLIGGVPLFGLSASLGQSPFFVIEADEYDTAFFDKRSKFVHYRPYTAILNNLEFDHADIFSDLAAIQKQFHHLVRTIPGKGHIILPTNEPALEAVLAQGCWSNIIRIGQTDSPWYAKPLHADGSAFEVFHEQKLVGKVEWNLLGAHNVSNALAAIAAASTLDIPIQTILDALSQFPGIKRRLEVRGVIENITVYDDFAHHPTAIKTTLAGLRQKVGAQHRVWVALELASNTMKAGVHKDALAPSWSEANGAFLLRPANDWGIDEVAKAASISTTVYNDTTLLIDALCAIAQPGDHVVLMSNGAFGGIHQPLLDALKRKNNC